MAQQLNRSHYATMTSVNLRSRLTSVRDRMNRAETMEASLADHFAEQEICAVLNARKISTDTGN